MNKTAIKNFAISARKKLIAMAIDKAGIIGITKENIAEPSSRGGDFAVFPTHFGTETRLDGAQLRQRENLVHQIKEKGYDSVMEEVAYTWFNRLIAVRFMEVNDYLPSRVRVLSSETAGKAEPDLVTLAPNVELGFTPTEVEEIYALKDDPRKSGELFKKLFIKQCNALGEILPELFEQTADYTELLLDLSWDKEDSVVRELLTIDEGDFLEAVEIIGWMYQYYSDDRKNEVINIYKGTVKKEDIPAATQLFTTDWVVRYMVDNSLGRYWIERNPQSNLAEKLEFLVTPKDGKIQNIDKKIEPTELTFFDPCMGSGHILVYAFDVLMEIYRECGYADRDAAASILQNNLFGLDVDNRAYQLSYFALMMRARSYDRRALTRGILPQVFAPKGYSDGEEYGSLLLVDGLEAKPEQPEELTIFNMDYAAKLNAWNFRRLLAQKYCIVCTNPPYLNKMNAKLKDYVLANYKDYSGDLFSVFMYHNFSFCKQGGYSAFMTPFVWMFIKTYEKLREYIIQNKSIATLVQMEYSAFEEATVPICSFVLRNEKSPEKGLYFKLSDFKGGMEVQKQKVLEAIAHKECGYFYETAEENFSKIPGSPIAYWVSDAMRINFEKGDLLGSIAKPRQGMATTNNNLFLRQWYEVSCAKVYLHAKDKHEAQSSQKKWFPYNKGGDFRKWYGNNDFLVDWENDGQEIKKYLIGKNPNIPRGESLYFDRCFSWSLISSSAPAFRFKDYGNIFDIAGMSCFSENKLFFLLALCNSKVTLKILGVLAPTINFQAGDIANIPVVESDEGEPIVNELVEQNIAISKTDWDSFETSWDFKRHPLV